MKQYLTGGEGRGCPWWASSHGGPRLWGIKERGGGKVNENIRRGGWSGLASGIFPCFGSLELRGGGWCVPLVFLARAVCVLEGGGGGMVGYKVATLGMMLLAMVLMLAGGAKPGQC